MDRPIRTIVTRLLPRQDPAGRDGDPPNEAQDPPRSGISVVTETWTFMATKPEGADEGGTGPGDEVPPAAETTAGEANTGAAGGPGLSTATTHGQERNEP